MSIYNTIIRRDLINAGWSKDIKYCITASDQTKYLLRISSHDKIQMRKELFLMLQKVEKLGIPICKPVEFGTCEDGCYTLYTWIDGIDANDLIPLLPQREQYILGHKAGQILRTIHMIPAPVSQEGWAVKFNQKTNMKIQQYIQCGLRFAGDEKILEYLSGHRYLLGDRPQCFQHGDFHIGNMMIEKQNLVIIDFDRFDFGDPWEEFNRIVWCAQTSPPFSTGMVNGYFNNDPPLLFWSLLAFYIASNTLSSIYWAIPFGQNEIDTMMKQSQDVLSWFNGMQNPVPTWYDKNFK